MTSNAEETPMLLNPQPSADWHRKHAERLAAAEQRVAAVERDDFLAKIQARAQAEIVRWSSLPCHGEVEHVRECSDAFAAVCPEEAHGMCPRRQVARAKEQERLQRANRRAELEMAGVSPRTLRAVFDASPEQTEAVVTLRAAFDRTPRPAIVVLQGGVGCGKSCAAALWAIQTGARWITAKALARLGYEDELTKLGRAGALVLDDLGTEYADAKGFFVSNLDGLIDDRYSRELPTVITTNVAPSDFKERYGERIVDRIREAGKFIAVGGQSLRRRQ